MTKTFSGTLNLWQRFGWFYKIILSVNTLLIGVFVQINVLGSFDFGVKAALFALFAAAILIVDLLPTLDGPRAAIAHTSNRITGAILGIGAGWNWISSETYGLAWEHVWPLLAAIVYLAVTMTIPVFMGILIRRREVVSTPNLSLDELVEEYKRLRDALADEDMRTDEISGCITAMELSLANILLFLNADTKSGLNEDRLNIFWVYADSEMGQSHGATAMQAHHRRLRMLVRKTLDSGSMGN